jgi:hypothetical protein
MIRTIRAIAFLMANQNLELISKGVSGFLRSLLGLDQIDGAIRSFSDRLIILEDRTMVKGDELLAAVVQVGTAIGDLSVSLATEAGEIKAALEKAESKNDPAIQAAIEQLDGFKVELGKIKDTAAGLIPNVETPEVPTEPTEPLPTPIEPLPELPEVELPVEITIPESGIDGAPAIDFE